MRDVTFADFRPAQVGVLPEMPVPLAVLERIERADLPARRMDGWDPEVQCTIAYLLTLGIAEHERRASEPDAADDLVVDILRVLETGPKGVGELRSLLSPHDHRAVIRDTLEAMVERGLIVTEQRSPNFLRLALPSPQPVAV
jgi:hypothetical protein